MNRKFSWSIFDIKFLREIINASDIDDKELYLATDDIDIIVSAVNYICSYPNDRFIKKYRQVIEHFLLPAYKDEVAKICKVLNITERANDKRLQALAKKPTSNTLIEAYCVAILNIFGYDIPEQYYSTFRFTKSIDMKQTPAEDIPLYPFQKEAVEKLKQHFISNDNSKGFLVMPTGSGKTRTATYFLIREMISRGYQIVWIAHRHALIDQSADCFYRFAGLSKIENMGIKNYRISCISGNHLRLSQIGKHEVIVASINSLYRNRKHLARVLGSKVMIVVDEAHHTFAPTYRETIKFIQRRRKNTKLLGLSATPVRANENDSLELLKLFDNKIVYSVSMADLITKKYLSDPKFIRKETNESFEPIISIDEGKFIKRYGDLPTSLVNKIVASKDRNALIIDEYLKNREKYGKTLIFAMNIVHCRLLCEELTDRGIKCDYVCSGKDDNQFIINNFKSGKLDVLVNVNIMTEGTDVPDIQTIFLTRPTQSEGLLIQMIGRGMRGVNAHGTEDVYIVDFYDKWNTFNKWLNPKWIFDDSIETSSPEKIEYSKRSYKTYEWSKCKELYSELIANKIATMTLTTLPVGWYTLVDEDGNEVRMLFYENQIAGINKLMQNKAIWKNDFSFTAKKAIDEYFDGFNEKPIEYELELLMDNFRNNEIEPQRYTLENRKSFDPLYVARKATEEGVDAIEYAQRAYDENDIVKDLYSSKEEYASAVSYAKIYDGKEYIYGQRIEELPEKLIPYDRTPCYDIEELYNEVVNEQFGGTYEGINSIRWTRIAYKEFYGRYFHSSHNIEINCVLNSCDVDKEVIKFVIYHEMLHRDIHNHTKEFYDKEHLYPNYEYHENFLKSEMNKFDISNW